MATKITVEQLRKLSPEKRIGILKKFEQKRKKEIAKAEELIKGTEKEIEKRKEVQEEIEEKSKELLEKRVAGEAGELELENIVEQAKGSAEEAEILQARYGAPLEELQNVYRIATRDVYDSISELRNRAATGTLSEEDRERVNFYESQFGRVSNVQAAYIEDEKKRINVMKAKTALEQIKQYESY